MVFSCQTSDETSESKTDLEVHLQAIEKSIVSNQFEVNEDYKISNVEFFEEIEKLKSSENHNRDFKVSKNSYKSSESYPQEISKEEEAII